MSNIIDSFEKINSNIKKINQTKKVNIIAVSKTFNLDHIKPLIDHGHDHCGENKVQEAMSKLRNMKKNRSEIKLHMIGKLQSNKAKNAFEIFDYIHSLDSKKLADIFSKCEAVSGKNLKYFIQVNIGAEEQKSGISISEVEQFYDYCKNLDLVKLFLVDENGNVIYQALKTDQGFLFKYLPDMSTYQFRLDNLPDSLSFMAMELNVNFIDYRDT